MAAKIQSTEFSGQFYLDDSFLHRPWTCNKYTVVTLNLHKLRVKKQKRLKSDWIQIQGWINRTFSSTAFLSLADSNHASIHRNNHWNFNQRNPENSIFSYLFSFSRGKTRNCVSVKISLFQIALKFSEKFSNLLGKCKNCFHYLCIRTELKINFSEFSDFSSSGKFSLLIFTLNFCLAVTLTFVGRKIFLSRLFSNHFLHIFPSFRSFPTHIQSRQKLS
jgi:hypothetical protein